VLGVGVGWYWFSPIALVDTSDMWLASRASRIAVNLAGIAANLVLAGIATLIACLTSHAVVVAALWQFALVSYVLVLANLNPLLEYDGYYVLMDWIEGPNLRSHCLRWLRGNLAQIPRDPGRLRGHALELSYGLASLAYVAIMGSLAICLFYLVRTR
jgi:putative peptide zinc metalloprotease protein